MKKESLIFGIHKYLNCVLLFLFPLFLLEISLCSTVRRKILL